MSISRSNAWSVLAAVLAVSGITVSQPAVADYKANELIVKYKDDAPRIRFNMNILYSAAGVKAVKHYDGMLQSFEHIVLEDGVKLQDAVAALEKSGEVEYVQPNYILRAFPVRQEAPQTEAFVADETHFTGFFNNGFPFSLDAVRQQRDVTRPPVKDAPAEVIPAKADPELSKAYGLKNIKATTAWKNWKGTKEFIVAVIDTGIDYNHDDLSFNVWRNPNPTQNDVVGFDFVHNDGLPFDDNEHGTHTAGTIGAVGGNGLGISGVSQRVSIMGLKFLSGEGGGTTADAIRAIDYAVSHGAKVLSNSWGGTGDEDNKALYEAIERAKEKDVLFIAAAGNDGENNDGDNPSYPAAFDNDNLISVAATDKNDKLAYFSNYGIKTTHVAAPGVGVYSTVPNNKYASLSGTSMACPHVAGAAALIWSRNPSWSYKKVKEVLMNSVDKLPSLEGKTVTGGRINLVTALRKSRSRD